MIAKTSLYGMALWLCGATLAVAAGPADEVPPGSGKTATQVCETAVTEAIRKARGNRAQQVQLVTPKHASGSSAPSRLQGEGRYQGVDGPMPFTYSCTFDPQSNEAAGVIFKETGASARPPEKAWQADLSQISPEVCEAAAAADIRAQFPRAMNIVLVSKSRQLKPGPDGHTYLHGQGSLERGAAMGPTPFTYRCELDTSTGKLIAIQTERVE